MSDRNNTYNTGFEVTFKKSLKSLGYLFPTSEDDVEFFIEHNTIEKIPINYCTGTELLSKTKHTNVDKKAIFDSNNTQENLAIAARKGKEIPEEILNKMKSDRDKIENGQE